MNWYGSAWRYRVKITVDSTKIGSSNLTDFPVYVDLSNMAAHFFSNVKSDGGDIRVTTADGITEVPIEVVAISTGGSTGELHFKAPTLSSTNSSYFYIYYGNSGASLYSAAATFGRQNVWRSEFTGVYHLKDLTTSTVDDSTSQATNGSKSSANNPLEENGKIGKDQIFSGTNQKITFSSIAGHQMGTSEFAIFAYLKTTSALATQVNAFGNLENAGSFNGFQFGTSNDANYYAQARIRVGGSNFDALHSVSFKDSNYHRFVMRRTAANGLDLFKDGSNVASNTNASAKTGDTTNGGGFAIGSERTGNDAFDWIGSVDELRVWKGTAPSDGWITADYNNFNSPSTFYALGSSEEFGLKININHGTRPRPFAPGNAR